jgi:hypothetical protein
MDLLNYESVQCPYCWQSFEVEVDGSVEEQSYIEDCQVCCQPVQINVRSAAGEVVSIEALAENA